MTTITIEERSTPETDVPAALPDTVEDRATNRNVGSTERLGSAIGGGLLALYGLRRGDGLGVVLGALGVAALQRGITGHCQVFGALGISTADADAHPRPVILKSSVTVAADSRRLYELWRDPDNLPRFMSFLDSVEPLSDTVARWHLRAPLGRSVSFDAEIIAEAEGGYIAWQSTETSRLVHEGEVRFREAPGNRGTEVDLLLHFHPPAGALGSALASLLDDAAEMKLRADLKRFKQWVETGEVATTEGQPSGR
jgi:uncharacterized membrane protein